MRPAPAASSKWAEVPDIPQDKLQGRKEQAGQRNSGSGYSKIVSYLQQSLVQMYLPENGENAIRIIPPIEKAALGFYGLEVHIHRNVGPVRHDYLCTRRMADIFSGVYGISISSRCTICEQQTAELWDEDKDLAKKYYPERRMLYWVQDLKELEKDGEWNVRLMSCPWGLYEDILSRSKRRDSDTMVDVSNPFTGCAIYFDREKTGERAYNIKYKNVDVVPDRTYPLPEELFDFILPFNEILVIPDPLDVWRAFCGDPEAAFPGPPVSGGGGFGAPILPASVSPANRRVPETDVPDNVTDDGTCAIGTDFGKYVECEKCASFNDCQAEYYRQHPSSSDPEPQPQEQPAVEEGCDQSKYDCFGKEYDQWQDCEWCPCKPECREAKETKPARPARATRTAASTPAQPAPQAQHPAQSAAPSSNPSGATAAGEDDKAAVRERLRQKIAERKRQIAK
jgi:hypothetical protein